MTFFQKTRQIIFLANFFEFLRETNVQIWLVDTADLLELSIYSVIMTVLSTHKLISSDIIIILWPGELLSGWELIAELIITVFINSFLSAQFVLAAISLFLFEAIDLTKKNYLGRQSPLSFFVVQVWQSNAHQKWHSDGRIQSKIFQKFQAIDLKKMVFVEEYWDVCAARL